jgi:tRNA(Ile)-lysidine synthase
MSAGALSTAEFETLMRPLGPFEPRPHLAVGVSGGADSMALAHLAAAWVASRGGQIAALVVDHGLRAESRAESEAACRRLAAQGITAKLLPLRDLTRGPRLAERARAARYDGLRQACAAAGILHLLLAHHAADQAETVAIRLRARSHPAGLAGMAVLRETAEVRLLRPLLPVAPVRLRATLREAGIGWTDDPSNRDETAQRARIRRLRADADGDGPVTMAMSRAAAWRGCARADAERACAALLASRARLSPEGYAILSPGPIDAGALAALIGMLSGAERPPSPRQVQGLADRLAPGTVGGVQVLPAGRLGDGWLLVRETAAMAPEMPAETGALWDRRFCLSGTRAASDGAGATTLGALGSAAAGLRHIAPLPAAVLRTLPAIRQNGILVAVPHLRYHVGLEWHDCHVRFQPALQAAAAAFVAAG